MKGIYRFASASPRLSVAAPEENLCAMQECRRRAEEQGVSVLLFPALTLTGVTCGDLFRQELLLRSAGECAAAFARSAGECVVVFGFPAATAEGVWSVAAAARNGRFLGLMPLAPLAGTTADFPPQWHGIPAGKDLIFDGGTVRFAIGGSGTAPLTLIPGAAPELPGDAARRKAYWNAVTGEHHSALLLAEPGTGESATDAVYAGHGLICCDGVTAAERFPLAEEEMLLADLDMEALASLRRGHCGACTGTAIAAGELSEAPDLAHLQVDAHPFLPSGPAARRAFCQETLALQSAGLCCRWERCGAKTLVLGVSGGLDSTLALLVLARSCKRLHRALSSVVAVTMPGFGTTGRTRRNAVALCEKLGVTLREISIKEACLQHFRDIGHDPAEWNAVYENAQARERTQILMDVANQTGGIVVGTGDLSELALGWCTYNGDQMSMYGVNASIPKSVIPALLEYEAERRPELAEYLLDVIRTPVSPELLPAPETGDSGQKTEGILGPYELHDFFLWHFLREGAAPEKIRMLAEKAFAGTYPAEEIDRCLQTFLRRFFTQQFKRSASPDGVQAGPLSLSPRGGLAMPSDISGALWRK